MNSFKNPAFLLKIAKNYLSDIDRLWRLNHMQLKKFQDKSLRNAVKYAYTVPVYKKKYKEHGVHPNDIRGIDDIDKLPIITKDDIRDSYPDGIIPKGFNKENAFLLSTSGSTGKPFLIYRDILSSIRNLEGFARASKAYGANWKKSKIMVVTDLSPGSVESATFQSSALPFLKKFISLNNLKYLECSEKPEKVIEQINEFNPDYLGSDPDMLKKLAMLKNEGYGKDINPKYIFSSSAMLDNYTRAYVGKAFNVKVKDMYSTTEGGPIAFECPTGDFYHIHSDFIYMEFLDEKNEPVEYGKPGRVIITKLYGGGTPIVRYSGLDDLAIPIENKTCCGITSQLIKQISGRSMDQIILPNGKSLSPFAVTVIPADTMKHFGTYKIKQFQIIQHKINQIEVKIVIDEKLRNVGTPVQELLSDLKKRFTDIIGQDVSIIINEIAEIKKAAHLEYTKLVDSKVK